MACTACTAVCPGCIKLEVETWNISKTRSGFLADSGRGELFTPPFWKTKRGQELADFGSRKEVDVVGVVGYYRPNKSKLCRRNPSCQCFGYLRMDTITLTRVIAWLCREELQNLTNPHWLLGSAGCFQHQRSHVSTPM